MYLSIYQPIHSLIYLFILLSIHCCLLLLVYCVTFTCIHHLPQQLLPSRRLPVVSIWFYWFTTSFYCSASRFYPFLPIYQVIFTCFYSFTSRFTFSCLPTSGCRRHFFSNLIAHRLKQGM